MSRQAPSTAFSILRLWFSFKAPVGRRAYALSGVFLMALKYLLDVGIVYRLTGHFWTPFEWLTPLWTYRFGALSASADSAWLWLLAAASVPFVWVGASMTARRALDAGVSPLIALLFFVPMLNYCLMFVLCFVDSKGATSLGLPMEREAAPKRLDAAAAWAILAGFLLGLSSLGAALWFGEMKYAYGLFLGGPFAMGFVSAWIYDRRLQHSLAASIMVVQLGVVVLGGFFLLAGLEGAFCLGMAYPLAGGIAMVGGLLGRTMTQVRRLATAHLAMFAFLAPALPLLDSPALPPPMREVVTAIEIDATPSEVWDHLVAFSELPAPARWFFRLGIAYPQRARIEGHGVGAVRYCEFSTGPFVEPITRWDEPTRLSFDVIAQPPTMQEWSPYKITPPHVTGSFHSRRGEFRLIELADGRTRLEGSTWYQLDLYPQTYWGLWSDALLHGIHRRVLEHIKIETLAGKDSEARG